MRHRTLATVAGVGCAAGVLAQTMPFPVNPDTWFFVTNGRQIVASWASGGFPSYPTTLAGTTHVGYATVIQQPWMSLLAWAADEAFGTSGLVLLEFALLALVMCALLSYVRSRRGSWLLGYACVAVMLLLASPWLATGRPLAVSVTLSLVVMGAVESSERGGFSRGWRLVVVVFLLSCVWVRFHAALWPLGLGIMGVMTLSPAVACGWTPVGAWRGRRWQVMSLVAFAAGGLTTSYGVDLPLYVVRSVGAASSVPIDEMASVAALSPSAFVGLAVAGLVVWSLLGGARGGSHVVPARESLLATVGVLAALTVYRNLPVALVLALPLATRFAGEAGRVFGGVGSVERFLEGASERDVWRRFGVSFVVVLALGCGVSLAFDGGSANAHAEPVAAADAMLADAGGETPRVLSSMICGSYLRYAGCDVSMDGRPELYSGVMNGGEDYLAEYERLVYGTCDVHDEAVAEGCTYVCLERDVETASFWQVLTDERFDVLYEDDYVVCARVL